MNRALQYVGLFLIVCCPAFLIAQTSETWTTYRDLDAVKIDYTTQECTGQNSGVITEFNFVRLTNKTANQVTITFKIEYYYNGSCTTCSNDEYRFTFVLPPNGILVPDCSLTGEAAKLAIIKRYVNRNFGYPLDRFELTNITVQ